MTPRLVAARRSAVAPQGGAFRGLRIEDLAAPVLQAVLADAGLQPWDVDELICSNALGAGGNPARRIALAAGLPERVAGLSIDRQCAGGLDAIGLAVALVAAGQVRVVLAGGAESHSLRPLRAMADPFGGAARAYDQAPFTPWPDRDPGMAEAAAALAARLGISRVEADEYAVESHARALAADFSDEVVPLAGLQRDPFTRKLTPEVARRAKALPGQEGQVLTAANTAVAADAAAFVLVVADDIAQGRGLRVTGAATLGADPTQPGLAPIPAIAQALVKAKLRPQDLHQAEVMEAYAVQAIACLRGAGLDPTLVNLKGGALARGHPIGASGSILAVRLFHDLCRVTGPAKGPGLAAIASAGGIGAAMVFSAD
ncbi:thiolase family protein [Xinfangfangia sp. CPCC 101601]|uniref:Thiolase family protein n=1 Tax=Pseudogemmobacter lacusdianii TaxID=3069608 RepID=A0ABU0VT58_9RHOB|nr:thiolase family protein [Xinfangfangia sp. CPCC 101601]MDQ2064911.1 thiolase family protein [Xinfangfangia sp. CPCC 101601]